VAHGLADADACERMRENVRAGRFTAAHYKQMWSSRLDSGRDNAALVGLPSLGCSPVATAASASAAAEELPRHEVRLDVMDEAPAAAKAPATLFRRPSMDARLQLEAAKRDSPRAAAEVPATADPLTTPFVPDAPAAAPTGPAATTPPSTPPTKEQGSPASLDARPRSLRKQVSYSMDAACAPSPAAPGSAPPTVGRSGSSLRRSGAERASSMRSSCLATLASVSIERSTFGAGSSSAQACSRQGSSRTPRGLARAPSASHLFPRLGSPHGEGSSAAESGRWRARAVNPEVAGSTKVERSAAGWLRLRTSFQSSKSLSADLLDFESDSPRPRTCIAEPSHESSPAVGAAKPGVPTAHSVGSSIGGEGFDPLTADDIDEERLAKIVDLDQRFPFDEVDYNRCALQLSSETSLDELHSLFSFMSMGHVWITAGGTLCGVVSDRLLIEACLPVATAAEA